MTGFRLFFPNYANAKARAQLRGDSAHRGIRGEVNFYQTQGGVLVQAEFYGLPYNSARCAPNILAMHIHEHGECDSTPGEHFSAAGGHYNPSGCPHPAHAGDLPPLFVNKGGYAFLAYYTQRFSIDEIIGRAVIVHAQRDDFSTQPSGDSGARIACGRIVRLR